MKSIVCAVSGLVFALIVSMPSTLGQVPPVSTDQWAPVRFLLGSWEGTSSGHPGTASVRRDYRFVLRDQFIEERHTSTYPPQEKNPKGEVHEHISYFSYDRARKHLVLRQFHVVERFVIQYVQEGESSGGRLAFVSESMENTPPVGARANATSFMGQTNSKRYSSLPGVASRSRHILIRGSSGFGRLRNLLETADMRAFAELFAENGG